MDVGSWGLCPLWEWCGAHWTQGPVLKVGPFPSGYPRPALGEGQAWGSSAKPHQRSRGSIPFLFHPPGCWGPLTWHLPQGALGRVLEALQVL